MQYKAGFFKPGKAPEYIAEFKHEKHAKAFIVTVDNDSVTTRVFFYTDAENMKTVYFCGQKFSENIEDLIFYDCNDDTKRHLSRFDIPKEIL